MKHQEVGGGSSRGLADPTEILWPETIVSGMLSEGQPEDTNEAHALYLPEGRELTPEQVMYLGAIGNGNLFGIPLRSDDIRASGMAIHQAIGHIPEALREKWSTEPLTDEDIIEPFDVIAGKIGQVREEPNPNRDIAIDPTAALHIEAQDFSQTTELEKHFSYMHNEGLHIRRLQMLADLTVNEVRAVLDEKAQATVVNFGPGIFPLERSVLSRLSVEERERTTMVGVDVSEDLLLYGTEKTYIDKGVAVDVGKRQSSYFREVIPEADVVVFAEILEHIDHVAVVIKESLLPWIQETDATLVGSVPNAVQLAEFLPMISGSGAPHQLRRPIFDSLNDHHSFFTANSLAEMLTDTWGFSAAGITSNGVRLQSKGNAAHLYAGLECVTVGDRLIFWAKE